MGVGWGVIWLDSWILAVSRVRTLAWALSLCSFSTKLYLGEDWCKSYTELLAGSRLKNWKYPFCHWFALLLLSERRNKESEGKLYFNIANHSIPHPLLVKKYLSCMHSWKEFSKNTQPTRILFIPQTLPWSCEHLLRLAPPLSAHQHFLPVPLIPGG